MKFNEYPGDNGIRFKKKSISMSKSEKIIHIKGSSKVKAHKRRIKISRDLDRIGDKEKDTKGIISTDYNESVRNTNDYISKLNEGDEGKEVLKSINEYTVGDYNTINEYMKSGESQAFKEANSQGLLRGEIPQTIKKVEENIINIKKFINDAPKFKGEVYRGSQYRTNNPESKKRWDNFIKNIEGSKEIKFGSFLSTSQNKNIAMTFASRQSHASMKNCLIIIKTKSGVPIEKISTFESENEVLLNNEKIYKIIKFEKENEKNHFLYLEEK